MSASLTDLRTFAADNGLTFAERGRPSKALVDAFNKGKRGGKRYEGAPVPTVLVKAKPETGRTIVQRVSVETIREWAQANGETVGTRGPVPTDLQKRYVLAQAAQKASASA